MAATISQPIHLDLTLDNSFGAGAVPTTRTQCEPGLCHDGARYWCE
jgi:hypothetical protein